MFNQSIDWSFYPEVCPECGAPARTEIQDDERLGTEAYQFCVNTHCMNFDAVHLKMHRNRLERLMRNSKSYQRHLRKVVKRGVPVAEFLKSV
jgi:hypothetical protein